MVLVRRSSLMLQSSLSEEEAEDLLWSAIATSPFLSQQLDSEDALALAKYLTIVPFDVADVVSEAIYGLRYAV